MPADSQITKIEIFKFSIPLREVAKIAVGSRSTTDNILLRVHTADGLYGIGEASVSAGYSSGENQPIAWEAAQGLARLLVGQDSTHIERIHQVMDIFLWRNATIKSAFDIALYDLLGKRLGVPLYTLFGGQKRTIETNRTIGLESSRITAEKALEIQSQGFRAIKLKFGTKRKDDVERARVVREAVGDEIALRGDANQGWDSGEAPLILRELEAFNLEYCEEPVRHWNNDAMRRVRAQTAIPIVADESIFDHHDALRLAKMEACDYFNIKLAKSGGFFKALKINAIAEAAGMRCSIGCKLESRLGLTAAAHLSSALTNIVYNDLDSVFILSHDPVIGGITYQGCEITLPDEPGLGADIDPDLLEKLDVMTITAD
jgi:L-alanine-DL-glutamate epimerase-like enolase superfamily enzyme